MNTNIMKDRQILGSFFAIMIILFSIGSSYVEAKGKITEPEQQLSFSTLSASRIAPQDGDGQREDLVTQYDLCITIYNSAGSDPESAGRNNFKSFPVNSLTRNGSFLLPAIHAP